MGAELRTPRTCCSCPRGGEGLQMIKDKAQGAEQGGSEQESRWIFIELRAL